MKPDEIDRKVNGCFKDIVFGIVFSIAITFLWRGCMNATTNTHEYRLSIKNKVNELLSENNLPAQCKDILLVRESDNKQAGSCSLDNGNTLSFSVIGPADDTQMVKVENTWPAASAP